MTHTTDQEKALAKLGHCFVLPFEKSCDYCRRAKPHGNARPNLAGGCQIFHQAVKQRRPRGRGGYIPRCIVRMHDAQKCTWNKAGIPNWDDILTTDIQRVMFLAGMEVLGMCCPNQFRSRMLTREANDDLNMKTLQEMGPATWDNLECRESRRKINTTYPEFMHFFVPNDPDYDARHMSIGESNEKQVVGIMGTKTSGGVYGDGSFSVPPQALSPSERRELLEKKKEHERAALCWPGQTDSDSTLSSPGMGGGIMAPRTVDTLA
ncbi:hypothetical protein BJ508DRAFT_313970 [Ascobolus immersus RN42]|uniref:Uncharacterized protein n=1 Tax=Ascobolus immersus RN42 TaxID=1160509 RepID=A0A3N4HGT1_ASCIM|nr:hypothetical protein BJ508DRAFT_313970 [Ascobolus immersus RN42]